MIQSENIDIGQVVGVGSPVMNYIGTDQFWVRESLFQRLDWVMF